MNLMKLEVQTRIKSIRKSSTMFLMMLLLSYSKADELGFSFDSCPHGNGKLHQDPVVCLDVNYREGAKYWITSRRYHMSIHRLLTYILPSTTHFGVV
jgi:hypothetical protein